MDQQNAQVAAALAKLGLGKRLSDNEKSTLDEFAAKSTSHQALVDTFSDPKALRQMCQPTRRRSRDVPSKAMWENISGYISGGSAETVSLPHYRRPGILRRVFSMFVQWYQYIVRRLA